MRTLLGSLIAALALWAAFVQWLAPAVPPLPLGAAQNLIVAERLQLDATDSSLLVLGSSMTARLPMSRVAPGAQAVGLSGGTSAMAVELAQAVGRRPRVAVVEANRLAWPSDSSGVDTLAAAARPRLAWRLWRFEYRPSTQALGLIVRLTDVARRVLMPEADKREAERRGAVGYGREEVDSVQAERALRRARGMLDQWRVAGTTVYLVDLPVHPLVAMSALERRLIDRAFPDSLFPRVVLAAKVEPTTDGRHLEADAARRVAGQIVAATRPCVIFDCAGARGTAGPSGPAPR